MSIKKSSRLSFFSGLLTLMLCWFFWIPIYGIILTLLTMVLAIIAIITGNKVKNQHKTSLDMVDSNYLRNARYGRVLGIIGIFINILCFIMAILFTLYFKFLIQ